MSKEQINLLSREQINNFFTLGYVIIPGLFNEEEIATIATKAESLKIEACRLAENNSGKVMHRGSEFVVDKIEDVVKISRIVWAGAAEPELLNISRQSKLLYLVSQLLSSKTADHLINQLHYKLPHDGVEFPWHQDIHNRRNFDPYWININGKGSFVQSIIAIDPMTAENGAIFLVPYSVKYGDIPKYIFQDGFETILDDGIVPLLLNPGDVVLMHPYLVHGSFPNESEQPRIILINGFSYPGANGAQYPGDGSTETIMLLEDGKYWNDDYTALSGDISETSSL